MIFGHNYRLKQLEPSLVDKQRQLLNMSSRTNNEQREKVRIEKELQAIQVCLYIESTVIEQNLHKFKQ